VPPKVPDDHAITIHLDKLLAERGMTLTELSERVGVSVVNLSILKNGHARAIRFSTLTRLCEALDCQPGDLLSHRGATSQDGQPTPPTGTTPPRSAK
jgi:putative transcriptional regulator